MTDSTLVTIIDDHQVTFDYKQATFDNGFVMAGDSAVINYIGSLSDDPVKAVLIKLISKKGHVMNAVYDPNKKLETAPMTKEEEKELEEAIEFAKKHQPKKNKSGRYPVLLINKRYDYEYNEIIIRCVTACHRII